MHKSVIINGQEYELQISARKVINDGRTAVLMEDSETEALVAELDKCCWIAEGDSISALARFTDVMREKSVIDLCDHYLLKEMRPEELRNIILNFLLSINNTCFDNQKERILDDAATSLDEDYDEKYNVE